MFDRSYFAAGFLFALFANAASVANSASRLSISLEAPSPVLGHTIRYWAYLPEDPLPPAQRYPVVYLLHGLHGNETRWFKSGLIAPLLDAAIAAGKIPPLIVVTPDGGDSWYVDNPDVGGFGDMATALATDFIAAIDSGFPTLACREARIVGGFSMGGTGAMILGIDHPDLYAGDISLSGVFPPLMPEPTRALTARYAARYEGAFGKPFDHRRFNQWNAFMKVGQLEVAKHLPLFYLNTGDRDEPDMVLGAAQVFDALVATYVNARLRIIGGGHDFEVWNTGLMDALEWMSKTLPKSCP
jgi:enterochelin esterase family protein